MTIDQFFVMACDKGMLRKVGHRTKVVDVSEGVSNYGAIGGPSLVQQIRAKKAAEKAKQEAETSKQERNERRERRRQRREARRLKRGTTDGGTTGDSLC